MFEKFTASALKSMSLARREAQRSCHDGIGTEHILLGLVKQGGGAALVLKSLNVDLLKVRAEVEKLVSRGSAPAQVGQPPFTRRAKRVLELAQEAATQLGSDMIGTEHLLLGILKESEGIAAQVLLNLGLKLEDVRDEALRALGRVPEAASPVIETDPNDALKTPETGLPRTFTVPHSSSGGLFGKFTDRARKVMELAYQEVQRFNHDYIGTEHILVGLVQEGSGIAARVLKNLNVDMRKVLVEVEKLLSPGSPTVQVDEVPFTPRAKRVLELALEAATQLGSDTIGTEHLLLGILKESEGIAAQVLINLGLKLEGVRDEVLRVLVTTSGPLLPPAESVLTALGKTPEASSSPLEIDATDVTDDAWKALLLCRGECQRYRHDYCGTEHILLGIAQVEEGTAARALRSLHVDLDKLRHEVELLVAPGPADRPVAPRPFTPRARRVLERAREDAKQGGGDRITGTEHLLRALLDEPDGIARQVLMNLGLTADAIHVALLKAREETTEL